MTCPWLIRALEVGDHGACCALWRNTEGIGDAPSAAALTAFLGRNPGLSPLACVDGQVVGALLVSFDGIRGYFYRLAVARDWRRRGLASALVDHALAALHDAGADRINLHLFGHNAAAAAFWRRSGWEPYAGLETWRKELPR